MERFVTVLAVLAALLVFVSEAQTVDKYFKAGGELQLSPVPVSENISSIVWKYDKNLLAEWVVDFIDLTYYSKFDGRSKLNKITGVLVVRGVTAGDNGQYSVEINNKLQSRVYQVAVIQEVPEPTVELQPLACTVDSEQCALACLGEIGKAGPVEYSWKKGKGEWETPGKKTMDIRFEETKQEETFSCRMKNPVSEKESKPFKIPVHQEPEGSGLVGIIVAVILVVLLVVGTVTAYFVVAPFKKCVDSCLPCKKQPDGEPPRRDAQNNGETAHLNLKETASTPTES